MNDALACLFVLYDKIKYTFFSMFATAHRNKLSIKSVNLTIPILKYCVRLGVIVIQKSKGSSLCLTSGQISDFKTEATTSTVGCIKDMRSPPCFDNSASETYRRVIPQLAIKKTVFCIHAPHGVCKRADRNQQYTEEHWNNYLSLMELHKNEMDQRAL